MQWFEFLLSPVFIFFVILLIGHYVGKIKLFNFSLGLAGTLFAAIFFGWLVSLIPFTNSTELVNETNKYMKAFSSLGSAIFVSTIGISTGYSLKTKKKSDLLSIPIGIIMVSLSFIVMNLILILDSNITPSMLIGIFCGALTTTPGLSVACEMKGIITQQAVLGYGSAYIFGVAFTVMFAQAIAPKNHGTSQTKRKTETAPVGQTNFHGLPQICLSTILGTLIGHIKLPFFNFSIGSSGGILCTSIFIGLIVTRSRSLPRTNTQTLNLIRNIGLASFFIGTGFPSGITVANGFQIKNIVYGILLTLTPIISGYILCRLLSKFFNNQVADIIAGGMTSTPAIAALVEKDKNISLSQYSLTYISALITIFFLIRCF